MTNGLRSVGGSSSDTNRRAQELADLFGEQIAEGSGNSFWGSLGRGGWNFVKTAIDVLDTPRGVVTSTVQELGDLLSLIHI